MTIPKYLIYYHRIYDKNLSLYLIQDYCNQRHKRKNTGLRIEKRLNLIKLVIHIIYFDPFKSKISIKLLVG